MRINAFKHVLYVDRSVVVLNKPPGLVCQPVSKTFNQNDDFTELLQDLKNRLRQNSRLYPVHRLDKATTGALLLARSAQAARDLSRQFQARSVEKTYLALVLGGGKSFEENFGKIRTPLQFTDGRVALSTTHQGRFAATDWELIGSSHKAPVSLLKIRLHTGLKHQIRIHLAGALKTPVIGDNLYSPTRLSKSVINLTKVPDDRLFLHALKLSFFRYRKTGPHKRCLLGISAPLPTDFLNICADLDIQFDQQEAKGGLFLDGVSINSLEIPELDGRWVG